MEKRKDQTTMDPEFRAKRKEAYNQTYFMETLKALRKVYDQHGEIDIDSYVQLRKESRNKNLLKFNTFTQRYFWNDPEEAAEAVENFNHKIKRDRKIKPKNGCI